MMVREEAGIFMLAVVCVATAWTIAAVIWAIRK